MQDTESEGKKTAKEKDSGREQEKEEVLHFNSLTSPRLFVKNQTNPVFPMVKVSSLIRKILITTEFILPSRLSGKLPHCCVTYYHTGAASRVANYAEQLVTALCVI